MYKPILLFLLMLPGGLLLANIKVQTTLCEYRENPIGVDNTKPALNWTMVADLRNVKQVAYRVLVADDSLLLKKNDGNIWDSKKVISDQCIQVEFGGKTLKPVKTYYWKVMVWDNYGHQSHWSKMATWQMGLLTKSDWNAAQWIGYSKMPDKELIVPAIDNWSDSRWNQGSDTLPLLRKEFFARKTIKSAVVYICGLGQFELSINGKKIGDHFLDPGWTQFDKHALYVSFDVTKNINPGKNAVGVMLGNGFYYIPGERYHKLKGQFGYPKMICRLVVQYSDGSEDNIVSDGSWKVLAGPVTFSSIYGGEDFNANLQQHGWKSIGFNDKNWKKAVIVDGPPQLDAQMQDPLKIFETFNAKSITQPKPGIWIYDMGQNASAIPFISVKGKAGDMIKITPGELLDNNGLVTQAAVGSPVYFNYTLSGNGIESWQPQFMYYGYRYLQIEGGVPVKKPNSKGLPLLLSVKSLHTRNAAKRIGTFTCSNTLFNKTFKLIDWAVQSNMASILTDCPHREKLGWLEETHLMGNSIQYNYNLETLFHKIVRDLIHSQTPDGLIPDIAPEYVRFDGGFRDSPEWGSSAVILPYDIYKWYGDKNLLAESFDMMNRYVRYLDRKAQDHILYFGLGDWYDIGPKDPGYSQLTPKGITSTAIFYYDLKMMTEVAHLLNKPEDEKWFTTTAAQVKIAYNNKFFDPTTYQYGTGSQTANAISVYTGLVDENDKGKVLNNIVTDIRKHHNSITAGDIGYRYLLKVLSDGGQSDVIFDMNSRSDVPGYGYQIKKGATALIESWQGNRNASNDHFMLGHLMEWFYNGLAGINQDDNSTSYRNIIIRPEIVGDVTTASASYNSPYGIIKSEWHKHKDGLNMSTTIPVNCEAIIYVPSQKTSVITESGQPLGLSRDVQSLGYQNGKTLIKVGSGQYSFRVK
ncbi:family 78 glycoside hydrolase catalytic domain [Mucilaginibacter sp.]|uniref:family 78 glycoside hydrolase catalytic domain n=1 Tax=Mucilaginibacter sp. TaxID=1882438 RepID=UPI003D0FEBA9